MIITQLEANSVLI